MLAARNTERVNMLRKHLLRPLIASAVIFMPLSGIAEETAVEITEDQSAIESSPQIQQELPLQDLRTFTEIFERIRSSYVEEVDDKKKKDFFDHTINLHKNLWYDFKKV